MIGDKTYRVYFFLRRSGCDEYVFARQVLFTGYCPHYVVEKCLWLRHFSCTGVSACKISFSRLYHLKAVLFELFDIVLHNPVLVHIGVHGRGNELGTPTGQHRGGEHIVGQSVGKLRADVGRGRGNDNQVGTLGQGDVLHLVGEIPVKGIDHGAAAGELLKGQGRYKLSGIFGHDHLHRRVLLDKQGSQSGRLVGGDSAGDAQQNGFSFQHVKTSKVVFFIITGKKAEVKSGFSLAISGKLCYNTKSSFWLINLRCIPP